VFPYAIQRYTRPPSLYLRLLHVSSFSSLSLDTHIDTHSPLQFSANMDKLGFGLVGPGLDFTTVDPMPQSRLLAYTNYFISRTVSFINRFGAVAEQRVRGKQCCSDGGGGFGDRSPK
jgi:hypothetical protein